MTAIIEAEGLTKHYGETHALDGLSLTAESGQLTALLGPNGAGKTTFISAVATLVRPNSGSLRVAGIDALAHPDQVRQVIGLAGQYASVEPAMSGRENLVMVGRLFGLSKSAAIDASTRVLGQIDLLDAADKLVRDYSGGMRRRLDLGASLVGSPRLLLLDEPTTGLDPGSRIDLWAAIHDLVSNGTDVLLTTQYLEEADQLARDVVIVDHGRVIAAGTPDQLKAQAGRDVVEVHPRRADDLDAVAEVLRQISDEAPHVDRVANTVAVGVDGAPQLADAVRRLDERDIAVSDIGLRRPTLDDVFLTLTGHRAEDNPAPEGASV